MQKQQLFKTDQYRHFGKHIWYMGGLSGYMGSIGVWGGKTIVGRLFPPPLDYYPFQSTWSLLGVSWLSWCLLGASWCLLNVSWVSPNVSCVSPGRLLVSPECLLGLSPLFLSLLDPLYCLPHLMSKHLMSQ